VDDDPAALPMGDVAVAPPVAVPGGPPAPGD
jgi:L-lactate dehydrogenase complex protein LldG